MATRPLQKQRSRSRRTPVEKVIRFAGFVLLLSACFPVQAQVETGKIVGSVKDESGALVAGAIVTVTETQTNVERKTTTNAQGEYVVTELRSGEYTVAVEHPGFKKAVQSAFKLDVNQGGARRFFVECRLDP